MSVADAALLWTWCWVAGRARGWDWSSDSQLRLRAGIWIGQEASEPQALDSGRVGKFGVGETAAKELTLHVAIRGLIPFYPTWFLRPPGVIPEHSWEWSTNKKF